MTLGLNSFRFYICALTSLSIGFNRMKIIRMYLHVCGIIGSDSSVIRDAAIKNSFGKSLPA